MRKVCIEPVSYGHRVGNGRHLALLEVLPDLIGQEEQETLEHIIQNGEGIFPNSPPGT